MRPNRRHLSLGGWGYRRHTEKLRTGRHNSWRNRASVNGSAGKAGSCSRMHAAPPRAPTFRHVCGTAPSVTRPSPTLPLDPRSSAQLYLGMCCSLTTYKSAKKKPKTPRTFTHPVTPHQLAKRRNHNDPSGDGKLEKPHRQMLP